MNEIIYERLAQAGMLRAGSIDSARIASTKLDTLSQLATEVCEMTSAQNIKRAHEAFALSASSSLAGGLAGCFHIDCRVRRVQALMQFAILYGDRVYVRNSLVDYAHGFAPTIEMPESLLRKLFADELVMLNEMRPAIEKGIIIPFSPPLRTCPHCIAKQSLGQDGETRFAMLERYLKQRYSNEVSVRLLKQGGRYALDYEGPDSLTEHGASRQILFNPPDGSVPEKLRSIPRAVRKADAGEQVLLSPAARKKVGLNEELAELAVADISFELLSAQCFGASFLTDRPVHIEALEVLSANSELERRNRLVREHLTSIVPFVEGVPAEDLLRLREVEGDAFVVYRQALNQAIEEYRARGGSFNERDARALYGDVIAPRLAALDNRVKSARKSLLKGTAIKIGTWAGVISFGMYTGFVPPELAVAAQALGLTQVVAELAGSTIRGLDADQHVREDSLFFLWKVRQLSRKS
jgi:hypothetical protein